MDPNQIDMRARAAHLGTWHNLVVAHATFPDALDLLLLDADEGRQRLLTDYARAVLARHAGHVKRGLAFWNSGDGGDGDSAAYELGQAGITGMELWEILEDPEQPLLGILKLGMQCVYSVGRDVQATITTTDDPF